MTDNRNSIAEALAAVQRNVNEQRMKNSMSNYNSIQEALPRPMGRPAVRPMSAAAAPARPTVDTASIYARHGVGSSDEDNGAFHRAEADIRAAQSAAPASSAAPVRPSQTPRPAFTGNPDVLKQQQALISQGAKIKADGIMGPQTRAAQAAQDKTDSMKMGRGGIAGARPDTTAGTMERMAKNYSTTEKPVDASTAGTMERMAKNYSTTEKPVDASTAGTMERMAANAPAAAPAAPARQETPAAAAPAAAAPAAAAPAPRGGGLFTPYPTNSPRTPMQHLGRSLGDASDSVGKAVSGVGSALSQKISDEDKAPKPRLDDYESGGPPKEKKKMSESTLINAFLRLQEIKAGNIFEAAKKAKKDWDGDGKIESEKDEVWGSRFKAAKKAGKMEEELKGDQDKIDANHNGKIDADDFRKLRSGKKSEKMKAYRADRDKHGEMEEEVDLEEASYSAKAARAGKDIGKPGKNFEKIASKAGKEYGSKAAGERVAGSILAKIRSKHGMEEEVEFSETELAHFAAIFEDEAEKPKAVHCSQCGKGFNGTGLKSPYKTGFSHCKDHKGIKIISEGAAPVDQGKADQRRLRGTSTSRGIGDTVPNRDLTDEYINEMAQRGVKAGQKRGSYKKKATDLQGNRAAAADAAPDEGSKGVPHVLDQIRHGREDEQGFKQITHPASSLDAPVTKSIHRSELHGFYDAYHNTEKPAAKEKAYGDFLGKHFDGDTRTSAPTSQSVTTDLSKIDKSNLKGGAGKISLGGSMLVGGSKK